MLNTDFVLYSLGCIPVLLMVGGLALSESFNDMPKFGKIISLTICFSLAALWFGLIIYVNTYTHEPETKVVEFSCMYNNINQSNAYSCK